MTKEWKYDIEKDIDNLNKSLLEIKISLENFIQYSREIQKNKLLHINNQLLDHELRIRKHTKFVHQIFAGAGFAMVIIDIIFKLKNF